MANENKPETPDARPWTRADEENLLLEISGDQRLVRLGIDPDAHWLEIYIALIEKRKALKEQAEKRRST